MSEKNKEPLSDEEKQARWDEYCKHRDQAWEDITSSSDEFDKSLLTYSTGALGLSLAFIKDIVKPNHATALPLLYWSWGFLMLCMILTIASYRFSIEAQKRHIINTRKFFLEDDEGALNKKSVWAVLLDICAYAGATFFLAGVLLTVLFVYFNISLESKMSEHKVNEGRAPALVVPLEKGRAPAPVTPTPGQAVRSSQAPATVKPIEPNSTPQK
jgi:hypothetical protein